MLAVLIAGGAWGWWWLNVGRFPLAGELSHDYGNMPIYGRSASAAHTFHLRNRTGKTITIEKIIPGCGCAEVEESTRVLEPGETVDISVTLTLGRSGRKKTDVTLVLGEAGVQTLWIEGTGRKELSLWLSQRHLELTRGEATPFLLIVEVMSTDAEPETPEVKAPEPVEVEFVGWERLEKRDARTAWAARWRGRFRVALTGGELPAEAELEVRVGESQAVSIALREGRAAGGKGEGEA